ncbi:MAG: glycosyltransferase family 2 protein [Bacilli bacterium]|nr:glycosyltransferase family 2 protein [Bacilli bacterium]
MKKVSIIIPIYNTASFLKKCLDSVVNQTYKNLEIILINDGSTDNSLEICQNYHQNYDNIIVIDQQNAGQGKARNVGINNATGDYLMFVDSDDWIAQTMIEDMYEASLDGKIDIVVTDLIKVKDGKEQRYKNIIEFTNDNRENLIISHPGPVAKMIKKELIVKNKLFFLENKIYEDLAVMPLIALKAESVVYLKRAYYYYLIRENSTMKKKIFSNKLDDIFTVMNYLDSNIDHVLYKNELEYLYTEHLLYSASLRYLQYKEGKSRLKKINAEIKQKYPCFYKNELFKKRNLKFRFITLLIYFKLYFIVRFLIKIGDK